jgi:cytochrome c biogenesis protein CcmG/thiol:disulfide interchange protein DsbE
MNAKLLAICLVSTGLATSQPFVRALLQPVEDRKPAPSFALKDAKGKTVRLEKYRGKVVLLDFWATWCTGCKQEIPWFVEFQKTYRPRGFAVVGVSVDEGGWKVLKSFLAEHPIPYRIALGDDSTMHSFGLTNLPDTFLIDKQGKIAAAYTAGLVNREDLEANIRAILK